MSEIDTELQKFQAAAKAEGLLSLIQCESSLITCTVRSEAAYNDAGRLLSALRAGKKRWSDWLKRDPGKPPSECIGLEGTYFFAYQALERQKKIVNDGLAWFEPREAAVADAIRDYDARKQEELLHKQEEEERKRREAEMAAARARQAEERTRLEAQRAEQQAEQARLAALRAKNDAERQRLEEEARRAREAQEKALASQRRQQEEREAQERIQREAEERQQRQAQKAEEIARGPEGTTKVTKFIPFVSDKAAFVRWICRTENWHLLDVAEGTLTKHVNALAGKNLPDGVTVRREDIIRRSK